MNIATEREILDVLNAFKIKKLTIIEAHQKICSLKDQTEEEKDQCWVDGCDHEKNIGHVACEKHHNEVINDKPKGLIRYEKQKPPKNKVVLFVWWHRNGIETSQKCCGFLTDSGKLITDLKFPKSNEPTYWKELF